MAEHSGLITQIDRWVLARAIDLIAEAGAAGHRVTFSANVSGRTLRDPDLPGEIMAHIKASGADPRALTIEVTETAAIADLEEARRFIMPLREFGIRFAVDDLGAGFAAFTYLKHLPVDHVKIDGSFITNLANDDENRHLVRAIVEVARGLGKRTVAEFVEDAETLRVLQNLGVDFAQGYYLGLPTGLGEAPSGVATWERAA